MRLGPRIVVGFLLPLFFVVVIGASAFWSLSKQTEAGQWVAHTHEVMTGVEAILTALVDAESGARGFALTGSEDFLQPYDAAVTGLTTRIAGVRQLTGDNPFQQDKLRELEPITQQRLALLRDLIEARRRGGVTAASTEAAQGRGRRAMEEIRRVISDMRNEEQRLLAQRDKAAADAVVTSRTMIIGASVTALVIVLMVSLFIWRSIGTPLGKMMASVEQVTAGNLAARVKIDGRDELAELAAAFNRMTELRQQAEAKLTEVVGMLSTSGTELLSATTQQASGVQEQSAAVTQVMTTVAQVTQTAEQAVERTRIVATSAQRSDEVASGGRRAVEESLVVLERARDQAEQVARNILGLAEKAQTIDEVLTTINELADQTNILSLNASVEAARAGEQGRGFQVIAAQIKELATQSKESTIHVRRILSDIQKGSNNAVLSTEEGMRSMTGAVRSARDAGETIRSLAEITAELAQSVSQISASAGQQAIGLSQVGQAMRNINQVTQQNLQATRQTEQTAQSLTALAGRVGEMLAK